MCTDHIVVYHVRLDRLNDDLYRKIKILEKPANQWLFFGVSSPGVEADSIGLTFMDASSYCIGSYGDVMVAGQCVVNSYRDLPSASILQPDLYVQRAEGDKLFSQGDEVVVTLDCMAHTLRVQSSMVDYTITIQRQHHQGQQWVLNVNFGGGDHQLSFVD